MVICGLLPVSQAGHAVLKGTDVYLFLTGMMLLAELARREGVFDWLASLAVGAAQGSRARLFTLVYIVGIGVTVFLSNDATAVVLTPAVYAAVQKARTKALPYLFICAFIANAASFVLPISNPANLVVYGKNLPPLLQWLRTFLLPSLCSIAATYAALRWVLRKDLIGKVEDGEKPETLSKEGRFAAWGIAGTGVILIAASSFGLDSGLPTCVSAAGCGVSDDSREISRFGRNRERCLLERAAVGGGTFRIGGSGQQGGRARRGRKLFPVGRGNAPFWRVGGIVRIAISEPGQ